MFQNIDQHSRDATTRMVLRNHISQVTRQIQQSASTVNQANEGLSTQQSKNVMFWDPSTTRRAIDEFNQTPRVHTRRGVRRLLFLESATNTHHTIGSPYQSNNRTPSPPFTLIFACTFLVQNNWVCMID